MRVLSLSIALAVATAAPAVCAQSSAAFPDPTTASPPAPAPAPPPSPAPVQPQSNPVGPSDWSGAAVTAAPATPVGGSGLGWNGGWQPGTAMPAGDAALDRPPPGYAFEEHTPSAPIVVGSLLLAIPYATGLGIAAAEDFDNASGWLALPVLGPWLTLLSRDNPCETAKDAQEFNSDVGHCVAEPFVRGMLVLDGVLQATGAVVVIVGASSSEKRLVPERARARVTLMPRTVGRSGYGLGLLGSF